MFTVRQLITLSVCRTRQRMIFYVHRAICRFSPAAATVATFVLTSARSLPSSPTYPPPAPPPSFAANSIPDAGVHIGPAAVVVVFAGLASGPMTILMFVANTPASSTRERPCSRSAPTWTLPLPRAATAAPAPAPGGTRRSGGSPSPEGDSRVAAGAVGCSRCLPSSLGFCCWWSLG